MCVSLCPGFPQFEKGSVESTHKVPTSHYHTKHRLALRSVCELVLTKLGSCGRSPGPLALTEGSRGLFALLQFPRQALPEAMFFFPGQQTSQRAPLSSGSIMPANRPFDGGTPQQHRPPAERMRSTYSGYPEHEFANFEADAFARRDASRPAANPSPYGVLVPRKASPAVGQQRPVYCQQKPPRSGGMSRPSQQQPSQRMRAGGPKARFPQNFPTHQEPQPF